MTETLWRHKTRGTLYREVVRAQLHTDSGKGVPDGAAVVVHRDADGRFWARSEAEFDDGRFELLSAPSPVLFPFKLGERVAALGATGRVAELSLLVSKDGDVKRALVVWDENFRTKRGDHVPSSWVDVDKVRSGEGPTPRPLSLPLATT